MRNSVPVILKEKMQAFWKCKFCPKSELGGCLCSTLECSS